MAEDPVRLFDESGSELLKSLLSAAREEGPNPAALASTLTAIGVGSGVIAVASASSGLASASNAGSALAVHGAVGAASLGSAKAAAGITLLVVAKWLGAGAVLGLMATSAIYAVSAPQPTPAPQPAAASKNDGAPRPIATEAHFVAQAIAAAPPEARAEPASSAAPALASASAPAPVASAPAAPPIAATQSPISVPAEVDPRAPLAAELALLDAARQALAAGNASSALRSLDDYDARFERPNLAPEALYLRLEALTLQGDTPGTQAVARRLLRSYPSGPHAARARAVLGLEP